MKNFLETVCGNERKNTDKVKEYVHLKYARLINTKDSRTGL